MWRVHARVPHVSVTYSCHGWGEHSASKSWVNPQVPSSLVWCSRSSLMFFVAATIRDEAGGNEKLLVEPVTWLHSVKNVLTSHSERPSQPSSLLYLFILLLSSFLFIFANWSTKPECRSPPRCVLTGKQLRYRTGKIKLSIQNVAVKYIKHTFSQYQLKK